MLKSILTIVFLLGVNQMLCAQMAGRRSFEFINIPSFARETGLGGINVSLPDEDINMVSNNPALTSDTLSGHVSFNYLAYFADVSSLSFAYQHDFKSYGPWFIGVSHFNYGSIEGFDDTGAGLGEMNAGETMLFIGTSRRVRYFTFGASLKFLTSNIAGFSSNAIALDIGGVFKHPTRHFNAGLVFKNVGFMLSEYSETSNTKLPFDIQAGVSFKPEHMPFRFTFTGYNLYEWSSSDANVVQVANQENRSLLNNVFRHIVIGAELLLTKNVNLRFGYNHLVRQELKLEEVSGGAGFSYGLMFKVKAFEFAYSRGGYHVAGGAHNFTLTANTNLFFRKGKLL